MISCVSGFVPFSLLRNDMPANYDKIGAGFLYPDNWQVVEEDLNGEPETVTLQSPTSGFWSLSRYVDEVSAVDLVDEAVATMRGEYDDVETELMHEQFSDHESIGVEMHFYCLDLLVVSQIRGIVIDEATYLLFCQAEDREFEELEIIFRAVTTSLLARSEG